MFVTSSTSFDHTLFSSPSSQYVTGTHTFAHGDMAYQIQSSSSSQAPSSSSLHHHSSNNFFKNSGPANAYSSESSLAHALDEQPRSYQRVSGNPSSYSPSSHSPSMTSSSSFVSSHLSFQARVPEGFFDNGFTSQAVDKHSIFDQGNVAQSGVDGFSNYMDDDRGMCMEDELMSCAEYGGSEYGNRDSPYHGILSPSTSSVYDDQPTAYWTPEASGDVSMNSGVPNSEFFSDDSMPLSPHDYLPFEQSPLVAMSSRSYTLESAIVPSHSESNSIVAKRNNSVPIIEKPARQIPNRSRSEPTSSAPAPAPPTPPHHQPPRPRGRPRKLPPLQTNSHSATSASAVGSGASARTVPPPPNTHLNHALPPLPALASQSPLPSPVTSLDEVPFPAGEGKPGQAIFKLTTTGPGGVGGNGMMKGEVEKKKPIMACLFCRERKIACGPPIPGVGNERPRCNQCSRRGLECEYPKESRRGLHKRIPRNQPRPDPGSEARIAAAPPPSTVPSSPITDTPRVDMKGKGKAKSTSRDRSRPRGSVALQDSPLLSKRGSPQAEAAALKLANERQQKRLAKSK